MKTLFFWYFTERTKFVKGRVRRHKRRMCLHTHEVSITSFSSYFIFLFLLKRDNLVLTHGCKNFYENKEQLIGASFCAQSMSFLAIFYVSCCKFVNDICRFSVVFSSLASFRRRCRKSNARISVASVCCFLFKSASRCCKLNSS